jgi:colanic acid biosynthesis glycosyl transferase WcaI
MTEKKVLVITVQYAPDLGPSAPIYTSLCEDLVQAGNVVTVVTTFPHYGGSNAWPEYRGKLFQDEIRNSVKILRSSVYAKKNNLWQRFFYFVTFNLGATLNSLRVSKPDIIIVDGPSLWCWLPALVSAVWKKIPFIYVVHDIYPDMAVRLNVITNPLLVRILGQMENFFYKRSKYISVLAEGFKDNLCKKGVPAEKVIVIPACTDVNFIRPLPRENKFREQWNLKEKFIILYTANLGIPQGLENLLSAAKLLMDKPDIAIVFVGEGNAKANLQDITTKENLQNVYFFPLQSRENVPEVFGMADISVVSLRREVTMEAVPSKMYSIMASGRPIIATVLENTEVASLIKQADCGIQVEPEDPKAFADAICLLHGNASLRKSMGENGRKYVVENYSRKVATLKYQALIDSIIK